MPELNQLVNGPIVGIVMKECARRATAAIRGKRFTFQAEQKGTRPDGRADWVTDADKLAQKIYTKLLTECFPFFGIVGEEDELNIPCRIPEHNIFFTVDPLDGTSAFKRMASSGIATMCSLVWNDVVIAVVIGDVLTGEIYCFRPDSERTHRIDQTGFPKRLKIDPERTLKSQYLLLRAPVAKHSGLTRKVCEASVNGKLFQDVDLASGSIGLSMARLWKGEVGGAILLPMNQTPWDSNPIIGMNKRLGFLTFEIRPEGIVEIEQIPKAETYMSHHPILVVHSSRVIELHEWCKTNLHP